MAAKTVLVTLLLAALGLGHAQQPNRFDVSLKTSLRGARKAEAEARLLKSFLDELKEREIDASANDLGAPYALSINLDFQEELGGEYSMPFSVTYQVTRKRDNGFIAKHGIKGYVPTASRYGLTPRLFEFDLRGLAIQFAKDLAVGLLTTSDTPERANSPAVHIDPKNVNTVVFSGQTGVVLITGYTFTKPDSKSPRSTRLLKGESVMVLRTVNRWWLLVRGQGQSVAYIPSRNVKLTSEISLSGG